MDDEHVSIVAPPIIKASIDVRLADKPWVIRSMPVTLDVTDGLLDKYKVTDFLKKPFSYERFLEALQKVQSSPGTQPNLSTETESSDHIYIKSEGKLSERRRRNLMNEVLAIATFRMRRELEASVREDPEVQELLDRVVSRELDPASAATRILEERVRQ